MNGTITAALQTRALCDKATGGVNHAMMAIAARLWALDGFALVPVDTLSMKLSTNACHPVTR
jgi:hypothetical protein